VQAIVKATREGGEGRAGNSGSSEGNKFIRDPPALPVKVPDKRSFREAYPTIRHSREWDGIGGGEGQWSGLSLRAHGQQGRV
jgi:hypothetical protein